MRILNPARWRPKTRRRVVYIVNGLGTPLVTYAYGKGWIGMAEVTLWGGEVAAAFTLAGVKAEDLPTSSAPRK